ncbi:MAG: polyprenyl synthetase family protein [Anaerovoracaceae bacterium]
MKNDKDYIRYKTLIEEHLLDFLPEIDKKSDTLYESMKYSLLAPGKRLRPALLLGACEFCGGDVKQALPYAVALEYIHTYSLIHDDLPCMDDDDLRRGLKTNHVVFGDGIATLAGDGLLNTAFETMFKDMFMCFDDVNMLKRKIRAANSIAKSAGCRGMVAGQVADIEAEGKSCSKEMLDYININKTGELIVAAVRAGAYIGDADQETLENLTDFAENLGLAFQITDDLLDVIGDANEMGKNVGVDASQNKSTYPAVYGIEVSKQKVEEMYKRAKEAIAEYYDNAEFFNNVIDALQDRRK